MINEHKRKSHVLVIGLEGAGKTLLIKKIKSIVDQNKQEMGFETNPTTGFDTTTLKINGKDFFINEIGSSMISNWHKFTSDTQSIIYVVDVQNQSQMAASMIEFDLVFNVLDNVKTKPFLIVFNKQDSPKDMIDKFMIESMFNINDLLSNHPNLNLIYSSALSGYNCYEVYTWIVNVVTGKFNNDHRKKNACSCL